MNSHGLILFCLTIFSLTSFAQESPRGPVDRDPRPSVPSLPNPTVNWLSDNFSNQMGAIQKEFKRSPYVEANPNLGSFLTNISIELPANLANFNALNLNYSSQNYVNKGLGVGWSWDLPELIFSSSFNRRNQISYRGPWGNFELLPTSEPTQHLFPLLRSLTGLQEFKVWAYRPALDEGGYIFLRAIGTTDEAWVALAPSGDRWVFSKYGQAIRYLNRYRHSVDFTWVDGTLMRISNGQLNSWSIELTYLPQRQAIPSFRSGQWVFLPKGLRSVRIQSAESANGRTLNFIYDDEYLLRARYQGSIGTLFEATYRTIPAQIINQSGNSLTSNDQKIHIDQNEGELTVITPDKGHLYVDLNGDQKTDRIVFDTTKLDEKIRSASERVKSKFSAAPYDSAQKAREGFAELVAREVSNEDLDIRVELAISDSQNEKTSFRQDSSIDLAGALKKLNRKMIKVVACGDQLCLKNLAILQFADINQDGLNDIFYVPTLAKLKGQSNIFSKWLHGQITGKPSSIDFRSISLSIPTVFILERDEEKLRTQWEAMRKSSTPILESNALIGYHKITAISDTGGFQINQDSPIIDLGDNRFGWIAGSNILIINGFDSSSKKLITTSIPLNLQSMIDSQSNIARNVKILNSSETAKLVRTGPQGKWTVISAREVINRFNENNLRLIQDGSTIDLIPAPPVRLMNEVVTDFGGKYEINYKMQYGIWALSSLTQRNPGGIDSIESYTYNASARDSFRGTWLGFGNVTVAYSASTPQIQPYYKEKRYFIDTNPQVILYASRNRLNGRLVQEKVKAKSGDLLSERNHLTPSGVETKDNRLFLLPSDFETQNFEKDGVTFFSRQRSQLTVLDWVKDPSGNPLFPLSQNQIIYGNGLRSSMRDDLIDSKKEVKATGMFFDSEYLLNQIRFESYDKNQVKSQADENRTFDKTGVYLTQSCFDKRCSKFKYDSIARLIEIQKTNGELITAEYSVSASLPTSVTTADGKRSMIWDIILNKALSIQDQLGGAIEYTYSTDGFTTSVARSTKNGKQVIYALRNMEADKLRGRSLEAMVLDKNEVWRFDGFGNLTERLEWRSGQWQSLGKEVFFKDKPLQRWAPENWSAKLELISSEDLDAAGRTENLWTISDGNLKHQYIGNCVFRDLNQKRLTGECTTSLGNVVMQKIGSEEVTLNTMYHGGLISLPGYGISFKKNVFNEVEETTAQSATGPSWNRKVRRLDAQGLQIETNEGFVVQKDSANRVIKTTSRPKIPQQVEEEHTYRFGLLNDSKWSSAGRTYRTLQQSYNAFGEKVSSQETLAGLQIDRTWDRDQFGRITQETLQTSAGQKLQFQRNYENNQQVNLLPWITGVERNPMGKIIKVQYANGMILQRQFAPYSSRLISVQLENSSRVLYREVLGYGSTGQLVSRQIENALAASTAEKFDYDSKNYQLISESSLMSTRRDASGNLIQIGSQSGLGYVGDYLATVGSSLIYSDYLGQAQVFCHQSALLGSSNQKCVFRVSNDEYLMGNQYIRRFQIDDLTIGIWLNGAFYPVVTDHLNSLKAMTSPDGQTLIFARQYGPWGDKMLIAGTDSNLARVLEQSTPWSYAGLVSNPIYEATRKPGDADLYWSQTRVYSPQAKMWFSVDPLLQWSPEKLLNKPGNWDGVRYAGNDPLNIIDPSGNFGMAVGVEASGFLGAVGAGVGASAFGFVFDNSRPFETFQFIGPSDLLSGDFRVGYGAEASIGLSLSASLAASSIQDLRSVEIGVGGSAGLGGDFSLQLGRSSGNDYTFTAGLGFGVGLSWYGYRKETGESLIKVTPNDGKTP